MTAVATLTSRDILSCSTQRRGLPSRKALARTRLAAAWAELENCHLCEHHCGVNRTTGDLGLCRAGNVTRFFSAQTEVSDELELIPVFAIALSGCDLRCDFCITGAQSWNSKAGKAMEVGELSERARGALESGARSVMVLGGEPTIHLPAVLELVSRLPEEAKLVWKTNLHGSAVARSFLKGMFDVWLGDYKFGNDSCAYRLSHTPNYTEGVRENLTWAASESDLIVRHLVMPGHVDCCWMPIAQWLAETMPAVKVSLRTGFWPGWKALRHTELAGPLQPAESQRALAMGLDFGLNLIE